MAHAVVKPEQQEALDKLERLYDSEQDKKVRGVVACRDWLECRHGGSLFPSASSAPSPHLPSPAFSLTRLASIQLAVAAP